MSEPDRAIARLEAAIADAGAAHEPAPGWEARVLAAIDGPAPPRGLARWWLLAVPALAAAAAIIIYLAWPRAPIAPTQLALAITIDRGGPLVRGASAHVGDTIHARASGGTGAHRAIWIYRDDRELVTACTGDAACTFTITSRGDYAIVALASDLPLPAPRGTLDTDVAAAAKAGARYATETLIAQ